jgi:group I intron endonuclease
MDPLKEFRESLEKIGCIYLIRNLVNGKLYVGQSKYDTPDKRWQMHLKSAKNGSPYAVHNAIRKYGEENFSIEVVRTCKHSLLGPMEEYYAEQYGSYIWDPTPGYNMVWCGKHFRLGITHNEETRKKLRLVNLGRKQSDETKAKRSAAITGQTRSQEACNNISAAKRLNPISPEGLAKLKEHNTGKKMSLEARQNMKKGHAKRKLQESNTEISTLQSRPKKEYECPTCHKVLAKSASLTAHIRTHTGDKPYVCEVCKKAFAISSNLDEHMFTHNPKSFNCETCSKKFNFQRTLNKHILKFHSAT